MLSFSKRLVVTFAIFILIGNDRSCMLIRRKKRHCSFSLSTRNSILNYPLRKRNLQFIVSSSCKQTIIPFQTSTMKYSTRRSIEITTNKRGQSTQWINQYRRNPSESIIHVIIVPIRDAVPHGCLFISSPFSCPKNLNCSPTYFPDYGMNPSTHPHATTILSNEPNESPSDWNRLRDSLPWTRIYNNHN